MTYLVTASRDQKILAREEHDNPTVAYRRGTELLRTASLVVLTNRDEGVVQHWRNRRPQEVVR